MRSVLSTKVLYSTSGTKAPKDHRTTATDVMKVFAISLLVSVWVFLSLAKPSWASLRRRQGMDFLRELAASVGNNSAGAATFEQPIDHSNPSLGTFKQRYWYNTTYWKGPGSPVSTLSYFIDQDA